MIRGRDKGNSNEDEEEIISRCSVKKELFIGFRNDLLGMVREREVFRIIFRFTVWVKRWMVISFFKIRVFIKEEG